jgi:hypothetical protein
MNNQELQILISMRDEFSQKLTGVENSLKKSVTEANKASISFKKLAVSIGGMATVYASLRMAISSVKAFAEFEETQMRLEKIVMNATGATKEQIQVLHEQARAIEAVGVVDKSTIGSAQAKLATFDLSIDAIKKLTPALLDMAVAEYGVGVSSAQVTNLAQGFGKALQGNTELLTKQGFKLKDYEIELLKTGDETTRLATLNEVLGRTYGGVNEEMTKTTAGAMKQFQNQMTDIQQTIGKELAPSLLEMSQIVIDNLPAVIALFTAMAKSLANVFTWITKLAGVRLIQLTSDVEKLTDEYEQLTFAMIDAGKSGDIQSAQLLNQASKAKLAEREIHKLTEAEKILSKYANKDNKALDRADISVLKGLGYEEEIKGIYNYEQRQESLLQLLNKVNGSLQDNRKIISDNAKAQEDASKLLEKTPGASVGAGFISEADREKAQKAKEKALKDLEKHREEMAKALLGFSDEYKKFNERVSDQLFDLEENHKSAVAGFKQQINSIRASMKELNESFGQGEKSDRMKIAEQIVANEERIADIQKELAGEVEKNKRREMEAELATMQQSMLDNADFINGLDAETAEVKRRASLTELERAIEDFNARRAVATQEYNEKMTSLRNEMREVKKAQREEKDLYQDKKDFIQEQIKSAELRHAQSMAQNLLVTKETIQKEIEYYRQLASAMDAVRGSNTVSRLDRNIGKVTGVNDAIISPKGDIITTHPDDYLIATKNPQSLTGGGLTININTMVGSQEYAQEMGNLIIRELQLQNQLG